MQYFWAYLFIFIALGFLHMCIDKQKAKKQAWRIPEAVLMTVAALGGSIGTFLGMHLCRHKTRHPKFSVGVPVILVLQIAIAVFLLLLK